MRRVHKREVIRIPGNRLSKDELQYDLCDALYISACLGLKTTPLKNKQTRSPYQDPRACTGCGMCWDCNMADGDGPVCQACEYGVPHSQTERCKRDEWQSIADDFGF
jgi:hypothetical protein